MFRRVVPPVIVLLALALLVPAGARAAGELRWRTFDAGLREAKATGRPVVVDVVTDWCRYCKMMERDVYSRADVRGYLSSRFVPVRFNAERAPAASYEGKSYSGPTLAQRFRVTGYPTTIFLRADGGHLVNVPGYLPPDRFLLLLRFVGDGAMERGEDFEAFTRKVASGAR